jgi:excisionase family DNA binding protein
MEHKTRKVITADDIKDEYLVNDRWIERHIESGDLKPLKLGRLNRFYEDEVRAYVERNRAVTR